jgi:salicylate hydroxylase
MPTFKILIIGGGLGGLAASIALGQIGHHVTVLESTPKLTTIGGGISIPPNSMRVMDHLGILQRVKDAAEVSASAKTYFRRYNGDLICDAGQRAKLYKYE